MKKVPAKKLTLSRETLQCLGTRSLEIVEGGFRTQTCALSCNPYDCGSDVVGTCGTC
jgi:hypothetical protein